MYLNVKKYVYPARQRPIVKRPLEKRPTVNENHGNYLWKCAVAGVQDVRSQETYHFIRYFRNFLKRNNREWQDILMHNLCTISGLTVDKPWNDLSRAWNAQSRAWNDLSRADKGTRVFNWLHAFCYRKTLDPNPKKGNNVGFNLDTLDGTRVQRHPVLKLLCISLVGPYSSLL